MIPKAAALYIGLGSNIGGKRAAIIRALELLFSLPSYQFTALSPFYVTSPVGPCQASFVNAVVSCTTMRTPSEVLRDLKVIERHVGRQCAKHWGPREIDMDILFYGQRVINTSVLTIPHPEVEYRRFVLEPLAQVAPHLTHPLLHCGITALRDRARLTLKGQKVTIYRRKTA